MGEQHAAREWFGPCEVTNPAGLPTRVWVKEGQVLRADEQGRVSLHDVGTQPERLTSGTPLAQTGPEFIAVHADSFGTGGKCLRCGQQATPGTVCDGASSAPKMPNGPWTEQELSAPARHGGGTDGYRCQCAGCVAARHQATIDKAFAPAGYVSALHGVPADPALNMVRWPLDELDWLERRADYLSNQINEFNRRLRTLLRRVRG